MQIQTESDAARFGDNLVITNGRLSGNIDISGKVQAPQQEISEVITNVSGQNVQYINKKQLQLRNSLVQLQDNRAGRAFQTKRGHAVKMQDQEQRFVPEGAEREPVLGDISVMARRFRGGIAGDGVVIVGSEALRESRESDLEMAGVLVQSEEGSAKQMEAYVAKGTYSLPVSLPQGQIRLDFARPAGDVELTIWAIPTRTLYALYDTVAVLVALAILLGGIKIWPKSGPRLSISKNRCFLYLFILVVTLLLLGIAAMLIAVLVVAAIEARRSAVVVA